MRTGPPALSQSKSTFRIIVVCLVKSCKTCFNHCRLNGWWFNCRCSLSFPLPTDSNKCGKRNKATLCPRNFPENPIRSTVTYSDFRPFSDSCISVDMSLWLPTMVKTRSSARVGNAAQSAPVENGDARLRQRSSQKSYSRQVSCPATLA